jgi:2-polyprenyl-3-methyl-5-hydroxy-6-metoxy-1,4-benzoquinol methylase
MTYPLPTSQQILEFYKVGFYGKDDSSVNIKDRLNFIDQRALSQFKFIEKYFPCLEGFEALEVGCAAGSLLLLLDRYGFHVTGYDPDIKMVNLANERLAKKEDLVKYKFFEEEDLEIEKETYDLVCSSHLLEHLVEPIAHLNKIKKTLKSNGILFIEIPNEYRIGVANCIDARVFPSSANLGHLYYYSLTSIIKMLKLSGFNILAVSTCGQNTKDYLDFFQNSSNPKMVQSFIRFLSKLNQKFTAKLGNTWSKNQDVYNSISSPFTTYWKGNQEGVWIRVIATSIHK